MKLIIRKISIASTLLMLISWLFILAVCLFNGQVNPKYSVKLGQPIINSFVIIISVSLIVGLIAGIIALFQKGMGKKLVISAISSNVFVLIALLGEILIPAKYKKFAIEEYGVFSRANENQFLRSRLNVHETDTIPAVIGTRFGIRYKLSGFPWGKPLILQKMWILPAPGLFDSTTGVNKTYYVKEIHTGFGDSRYLLFKFDHKYELLPGIWKIQILQGKSILAEKSFYIVVPNKK